MCPVCLSTIAWLIAGGVSALVPPAVIAIARNRKIPSPNIEGLETGSPAAFVKPYVQET